ncbi:MAG: cation transporter [Firmicutes bacterium HGW-Firmicutes-15]|nr:MAG: cation transporter [Firmicutes bacterium HGW-Firmicutes-15]
METMDRKAKVALLSVCSNTALIILKTIAGIMSGSVSILSEAIHSSMDLIASIVAFLSVRMSSQPADEEHPYGHGKIENISGLVEGLLIFVAAFLIIKEAVHKISQPSAIDQAAIAIGVMLISALVNTIVSRILYKVAKEEDSLALEADALHLKTDVYTSLGVGIGILLIKLTGNNVLDPVVAILVALLIIKESWNLCSNAFKPLLDNRLSDQEEEMIREAIRKYNGIIIDFHELRTRKSGNMKYVDFDLIVDKDISVEESHALSTKIVRDLEAILSNVNVSIYVKPGNMPNPAE